MSETIAKLRLWKKFFGGLFFFSFILFLLSSVNVASITIPIEPQLPNKLTLWISIASLAISAVSLLGFFLTTILAWRKERREVKSFEIDNMKKELEIEKLKAELQQTKNDAAHPALDSKSVITHIKNKKQRIKN